MVKEMVLEDKERSIQAFNPVTNETLKQKFPVSSRAQLDETIIKADQAFQLYSKIPYTSRADFLTQIGIEINNLGDELVKTCMNETGLPEARIIGERGRTVTQLNLFADLLRDGSWLNAKIDTSDPNRMPMPKPDIRQTQIPLGPVGIFEASNFPLAFSTAGGDTASALAAGCTVVAKSHSGHPGTSSLIAKAIIKAIKLTEMPEGTFTLVHGPGNKVGMEIVNHPLIKAIGFTGSYSGGKTLFDAASKRPEPIPVFAEMGSVNPVFILPEATKLGEEIAAKLVDSIVLGTGQFCTNPGMIIVQESVDAVVFKNELRKRVGGVKESTMLSHRIKNSFDEGVARCSRAPGTNELGRGKGDGKNCQAVPVIFETSFKSFAENKELSEEVFGPSSLVVSTKEKREMIDLAKDLSGHLTVTVFGTKKDLNENADLLSILEKKTGRLILNGVPTGVEVCHAMVHGGPFPATTDGRTSSVGTTAIYRFTRPICFQNFPNEILPEELKNENPLGVMRLLNGELTVNKWYE